MFDSEFKTNLVCADTPEGDKARELMALGLEYWYDMIFVSRITSTDVGDQGFVSEDMPFVVSGPWAMPRYLEANPNLNIGVAPLPAHPETRQVASYWYEKALALFKTNEEREEAALKFIKWFYTPEIHARWCAEASYLPITLSAAEHPIWQEYVAEHPYVEAFLAQTPTMRRRPNGIPIGSLGGGMLHPVVYEGATPEEAIENYCLDAQALLDEFWAMRSE
jgi:multiple sugar transport system substrate-binding protein